MNRIFTADDLTAVLAHIESMLRDLGVPADTGACKCGRCERKHAADAPARAASASDAPGPSGGQLIPTPAPAPAPPAPSGIAATILTPQPEATDVLQWVAAHRAEYDWMVTNETDFEFAASVLAGLRKFGSLTERQLAAVQRCMARDRKPAAPSAPAPVRSAPVRPAPARPAAPVTIDF
jgi:hypothetical protein